MEAVILLAHGAPRTFEEVDSYVLRIRHGRPLDEHLMQQIRDRYRLIGGSPLLHWTTRQAQELQKLLPDRRVYFGMKYSEPFIRETVDTMIADGVRSATAICLAPQFSKLTIGGYQNSLHEAIRDRELSIRFVAGYAIHPQLIAAFAANLKQALSVHPGVSVIFTAHSLPARAISEGDPYDYQVKQTAALVARACNVSDWRFAYQSQGMTGETWLGPTVESRLDELAAKSITRVAMMPIGFVCDHVEILYDIDIHFRNYAAEKAIELYRAPSLNDSPQFIELLRTLALS